MVVGPQTHSSTQSLKKVTAEFAVASTHYKKLVKPFSVEAFVIFDLKFFGLQFFFYGCAKLDYVNNSRNELAF